MMRLSEIHLRDPFILPVRELGLYYLFGTTDPDPWNRKGIGFDCYTSPDLRDWTGPAAAFRPAPGFWADRDFWAPEVHGYGGSWYMFASFKAEGSRRGTQVLRADSPAGPFLMHSPAPVTPGNWECLDGTLHIDTRGVPWLVFCHEWVQVFDGSVCAVRLSDDLTRAVGGPRILFNASRASWVRQFVSRNGNVERSGFVTDGPFLYRAADGGLVMLWSSFSRAGYAMGIARSRSGEIDGPWEHRPNPLVDRDGGHGMAFRDFDGVLHITFHAPNRTPDERPILIEAEERDGSIALETG